MKNWFSIQSNSDLGQSWLSVRWPRSTAGIDVKRALRFCFGEGAARKSSTGGCNVMTAAKTNYVILIKVFLAVASIDRLGSISAISCQSAFGQVATLDRTQTLVTGMSGKWTLRFSLSRIDKKLAQPTKLELDQPHRPDGLCGVSN